MKPTRGTILAALVLVAGAAPVTAYAVAEARGDSAAVDRARGHASGKDKPHKEAKAEHPTGTDRADEASGRGRAHAEAMKAWARCVAEAASGAKAPDAPVPPKLACDDKPIGPGRAKHLESGSVQAPPGAHGPNTPKVDRPGPRR